MFNGRYGVGKGRYRVANGIYGVARGRYGVARGKYGVARGRYGVARGRLKVDPGLVSAHLKACKFFINLSIFALASHLVTLSNNNSLPGLPFTYHINHR